MMITQVDLYPRAIPLKQPFVISQGSISSAANVFVRLTCDNGLIGWGEACPFPYLVGESQATVMAVANQFRPLFLGRNPLEINRLVGAMDKAIKGNATCKSMFDMALYDLAARAAGVPLYRFLGGADDRPIFTDNTISIGTPTAMAATAVEYVTAGYTLLKVKLSGRVADDLARVRAIREAVGTGPIIRIDANQGWTVDQAVRCLRALEPFRIQHCEAPISRRLSFRLPEVRRAVRIPIMADEALFDHHDAAFLAKMEACDRFNIKLCKAGGIHKARKILAIAEAFGIPCQVGGMSESRLGTTAAAHFALSSPLVQFYDLDMPIGHAEDPTTGEGVRIGSGGKVTLSTAPGLDIGLVSDDL